jgi:hypothetical protein
LKPDEEINLSGELDGGIDQDLDLALDMDEDLDLETTKTSLGSKFLQEVGEQPAAPGI